MFNYPVFLLHLPHRKKHCNESACIVMHLGFLGGTIQKIASIITARVVSGTTSCGEVVSAVKLVFTLEQLFEVTQDNDSVEPKSKVDRCCWWRYRFGRHRKNRVQIGTTGQGTSTRKTRRDWNPRINNVAIALHHRKVHELRRKSSYYSGHGYITVTAVIILVKI